MTGPGAAPLRATYRVQLRDGLDLRAVERLVPELDALGVSHVYLSPIVAARSGSPHGYDVVDPGRLDPALGSEEDLAALAATLSRHGMGILLDHVPNHACVHPVENPWWRDVLEWGEASPFASTFDVEWDAPEGGGAGRLLVPVLGQPYGDVLEAGELALELDRATARVGVRYHEWRFPLSPDTAARALARAAHDGGRAARRSERSRDGIEGVLEALRAAAAAADRDGFAAALEALRARLESDSALAPRLESRLATLYDSSSGPTARARLHALLEAQVYRLSWWRRADQSLDYRRFFDVSELAGLRVERPEVFEAVHAAVLRWIADGLVSGLRIDHVDGLRDPGGYLEELRRRVGAGVPVYVEKILEGEESLPDDWPVEGTTGYEFLTDVGALLVDPAGEPALDALDRACSGRRDAFPGILHEAKGDVVRRVLGSELYRLARELGRIAAADRALRDWTRPALETALAEVLVGMPVYRTYVRRGRATAQDRAAVEHAVEAARARLPEPDGRILDAIASLLLPDPPGGDDRPALGVVDEQDAERFRARFQQTSGAVMAKGMEDTAFFRFFRLVALNEVGGDPGRFGLSVDDFHRRTAQRSARWPDGLLATSTHDTKWGEDTRARIAALSEEADAWAARVGRWRVANDAVRGGAGGPPCGGHELLLYQALVGTWPLEWLEREPDARSMGAYRERLEGFMRKAVREGKRCSSWRAPDEGYEAALCEFLGALLDARRSGAFLDELRATVRDLAPAAAQNGLVQTVLKLTLPGVPDLYQGTERWQLALTDPDNRRPVDWSRLREDLGFLDGLDARSDPDGRAELSECLRHWPDGRIKTWVVRRLLHARRAEPELFARGAYAPARVVGEGADRVLAFVRAHGARAILVAVPVRTRPRHAERPLGGGWPAGGGPHVRLPLPWAKIRRWRSLLGEGDVEIDSGSSGSGSGGEAVRGIPVDALWPRLPVAVWVGGGDGDPGT